MPTTDDKQALLRYRVGPVLCCGPSFPVAAIIHPPPLTHPPGSNPGRPGIFRHNGQLVSVIDLRQCFGLAEENWHPTGRIIICNMKDSVYGFLVDQILDVMPMPSQGWGSLPALIPRGIFSRTLVHEDRIHLYAEFDKLPSIPELYLQKYIEHLQAQQATSNPEPRSRTVVSVPGKTRSSEKNDRVKATTTRSGAAQMLPATDASAKKQEPKAHATAKSGKALPRSGTLAAGQHSSSRQERAAPATARRQTTPRAHSNRTAPAQRTPATNPLSRHQATETAATVLRATRPPDTHQPLQSGTAPTTKSTPAPVQAPLPAQQPVPSQAQQITADDGAVIDSSFSVAGILVLLVLLSSIGSTTYYLGFWTTENKPGTRQAAPLAQVLPSSLPPDPGQENTSTVSTYVASAEPTLPILPEPEPVPVENPPASTADMTSPMVPTPTPETVVPGKSESPVDPMPATEAGAQGKTVEYRASIQRDAREVTIVIQAPEPDALIINTEAAEITPQADAPPAADLPLTEPPGRITPIAEPQTAALRKTEIIHIVVKGDTLWDIASKYVQDPFRYPELARLSHIKNPHRIYPGDRVRIIQYH